MIRALFLLALSLGLLGHEAQAQINEENCKPQPQCRILYTPLKPGAPTTGLRPQESRRDSTGRTGDAILRNESGTQIKRDLER
jgi:hypothetical protein